MLQLAEAARQGWAQDWAAAVRKHRARMKQRQEEGFEEAQKLAAHGRRSEPIAKSLFPSQAGALFREPDVAQGMHMWSWVFPVAHRVLERMGRDCRGLSGDRVLEWQRLHTTITAGPKVSRPTRAEQRQAACRAAAVGVDTRAGAEKPTASQVAASLRERLVAFAGIRRGVKVALCPRAAKLEQGHLIIRCVVEKADALAESIWHHVSHCFWAPRVQPALMRLCLLELSEGLARLEPMHAAGEKLRTFWWQDLAGLAGMEAYAPRRPRHKLLQLSIGKFARLWRGAAAAVRKPTPCGGLPSLPQLHGVAGWSLSSWTTKALRVTKTHARRACFMRLSWSTTPKPLPRKATAPPKPGHWPAQASLHRVLEPAPHPAATGRSQILHGSGSRRRSAPVGGTRCRFRGAQKDSFTQ